MIGDYVAVCIGVLAAALYLGYGLWRRRERSRQQAELNAHYGSGPHEEETP